ncbi:MAG: DUF3472 domain-containing protein [Clostridia bacterium]|nr:DUF3472 domain-containing protein [Clostridia bacterium]
MAKNLVRIPLAGNAYLETATTGGKVTPGGISEWSNPDAKFGVYVRFAHACTFDAAIRLRSQKNNAKIRVNDYEIDLPEGYKEVMIGSYSVENEGYFRFEMQGIETDGTTFASPTELILYGITKEDISSAIFPEDKDSFYWTRRGPSVHCGYDIKDLGDVEWFYSEVTVPEGYDPVGSYYMGIGFRGGYFGMQTNSKTERKILFSVWSPFVTDNPEEIPEEDRILCRGKNTRTHIGEFGGEGSGGQSFLKYNWKTGETQKFLVNIHPEGNGRTLFTAYFYFPDRKRWEMVASFSRPKTETYIIGPHSFLENFWDRQGHITRMAFYGNQFAYKDGKWIPVENIRFTGDNTARQGWRMDYDGGLCEDGRFYLKNGGFFDQHEELNKIFTRDTAKMTAPDFDPEDIAAENEKFKL